MKKRVAEIFCVRCSPFASRFCVTCTLFSIPLELLPIFRPRFEGHTKVSLGVNPQIFCLKAVLHHRKSGESIGLYAFSLYLCRE